MEYPSNTKKIRLIPYFNDLNCTDDKNKIIKTCKINRDYFRNEKSGYYYAYHETDDDIYSIFYEYSPIKVILPNDRIYINIVVDNYVYLGEKGTFYLNTDFFDSDNIFDSSYIERTSSFSNTIYDYRYSYSNYRVTCRLWKPANDTFKILCKMNDNYYYDRKVYFNDCSFTYIGYLFKINKSSDFNLNHINPRLPFLYSEKQIIKIEDNKDSYELKFKIEEYSDQLLYLTSNNYDFIYLDNCDQDGYEIKCEIEKEYLEEVLQNNLQHLIYFHIINL